MAERYEEDTRFLELIEPYVSNPEFLKLKNTKHHNDSVYNHTLRVAYKAFRTGRFFKANEKELLRGALFHDLYFHDWRDKEFIHNHGWTHPGIALNNARKLFGPLTEREEDMISSHMWPFNFKSFPSCKESLILTFSDKWVATGEIALMVVDFFKCILSGKKPNI